MKRVLIISPYFPPVNAADMQRIRMSLPFFKDYGWDAEIVTVDPVFVDMGKDPLLVQSIPHDIKIHQVAAFSKKHTQKLGLGSIALRSWWFYRTYVDRLLKKEKFDLIYFSTTQFPVCTLGAHWKKKYRIPYVIDMQDPWHSDYYKNKPKNQRPPKYWFSYYLNKFTEPIAMNDVDGLISVSQAYIDTLRGRYPVLQNKPAKVITFGAFAEDFSIAANNKDTQAAFLPKDGFKNIVYIGRGGHDMEAAVTIFFTAFKNGLKINFDLFSQFRIHFIGTSYAPVGKGLQTIFPIAEKFGLGDYVNEQTDRLPFYQSLNTLKAADVLFIPGSNDPQYTASKVYPYLMAEKPIVAVFNSQSNAVATLKECSTAACIITFDDNLEDAVNSINTYLVESLTSKHEHKPDATAFNTFSAQNMTLKQTQLFESVIKLQNFD